MQIFEFTKHHANALQSVILYTQWASTEADSDGVKLPEDRQPGFFFLI